MQEEKQVGVVLLDIGGGTTDIAVYSLGSAIYTATIPVGGNVLTSDISLGLKTTLAEAEEVKKRFGRPRGGTGDASRSVRSTAARRASTRRRELRQIVVPRVLETLRMAKQKIVENVPRDLVLGEVVLTGGGALLPGIEPIAEEVFGLPVRDRHAANAIGGLTDAMTAPQYATAIGLVLFGANGDRDAARRARRRGGTYDVHRIVQRWLADLMDLDFDTLFRGRNPKEHG